MKRITEPSDIANAAWYLGSEQSAFVTGTTLEVSPFRSAVLPKQLLIGSSIAG
jgi:hypothetical protein